MAVRVLAEEVLEIMDGCSVSTSIVDSLIVAANAVVNKVFENDTETSSTLLKEIEKWYTAHMLASSLSRTTQEEKLGDASVIYTGKYGMMLDSTPYGQMVKTLDITGKMANTGKSGATIRAIPNFD